MRGDGTRADIHALIAQRRAALDEPGRQKARRLALWGLLGALALSGVMVALFCL
jgi:hypothetical protein